jgi:hypothetical protein
MTLLLLAAVTSALLGQAPCLYWTGGPDSRAALEKAGIKRLCVAPENADTWRTAGFAVNPITPADLAARALLPPPGVTPRAGLASPTRSPWIVANGWRFTRQPESKYVYDVPRGMAALAAAESYAYGADVVLKIDPADVAALGGMLTFLEGLPAADLPAIADLAVVEDGTAVTGEVMNLLARRNLLFEVVPAASTRYPITIAMGSPGYPVEDAADPSAFALKIRRQLTDEKRTLRVYGSEVVIARLTGDGSQVRLHLLNYGGREIEGLRIRVRGAYASGDAQIAGAGRLPLADHAIVDGFTEFSVSRLATYAVVDLKAAR